MAKLGTSIPGRLVGPRIAAARVSPMRRGSPAAKASSAGRVAPAADLHAAATQALAGKLAPDPGIRFGDSAFYLPTADEVDTILAASRADRRRWLAERYDCDDFAYVLKGEMSAHAYASAELRHGLCVGIAWGDFDWVDGLHAVNWFIAADGVLRFIEPQTDRIHDVSACKGGISLLLV